MANFYVKKIESTGEATEVNSKTNTTGLSGSILKTSTQVGIFNKKGSNFYVNGQLNTNEGVVLSQSGSNFVPTRSNLSNLINNSKIKNVFNAINYKNNTFNLKRISNPNNNTISNTTTNSYYQRRQRAKYCIYFKCGEREGFFEYNDNNMLLSEAYNKFREKYTGMPVSGRLMILTETYMGDLDEYKSLKDNGIKDGDKIAIIIE